MAMLLLQQIGEAPWFATAAAVVVTLYLVLYRLQYRKGSEDEPPIVASWFPFVGHPLGMLVHGGRYVKRLGLQHRDKPIFTLPVPASRLYIVTDPSLAAAVQRASKALSFTPLVPDVTRRVLGFDAPTARAIGQNLDPEPGEPRGVLAEFHDMVYSYLGPGAALNELTASAEAELCRRLNDYARTLPADGSGSSQPVDLLAWIRHIVTIATAEFLYGPHNPIAEHPDLEAAFWDFDHGLGALLLGVAPSITASKPFRGREAMVKALIAYLEAGHHKSASRIVQNRIEIAAQHGFSTEATARSELSFLFAGIVNTATTTFWVVLQIFARPELLRAVRDELQQAGAIVDQASAGGKGGEEEEQEGKEDDDDEQDEGPKLSQSALKNSAPLLASVFRECLRLGSDNYSTRLVKADTVVAGHRLRAGGVVQVAGGVIHADASIWGADAATFRPERFLRLQQDREKAVHPAAFRAFGGGKTLCPGRYFATDEILAFAAMVVLMFDISGPAGRGSAVAVPRKDDGVLPVHILEPVEPVKVTISVQGKVSGIVP